MDDELGDARLKVSKGRVEAFAPFFKRISLERKNEAVEKQKPCRLQGRDLLCDPSDPAHHLGLLGRGPGKHRRDAVLPTQADVDLKRLRMAEKRAHMRIDVCRLDAKAQRSLDLARTYDLDLLGEA